MYKEFEFIIISIPTACILVYNFKWRNICVNYAYNIVIILIALPAIIFVEFTQSWIILNCRIPLRNWSHQNK